MIDFIMEHAEEVPFPIEDFVRSIGLEDRRKVIKKLRNIKASLIKFGVSSKYHPAKSLLCRWEQESFVLFESAAANKAFEENAQRNLELKTRSVERKRLHASLSLSHNAIEEVSKQTKRRRRLAAANAPAANAPAANAPAAKAPAAPVSPAAPSSDDVIDAISSAPSEESISSTHAAVPIASASDLSSTDSAATPVYPTANSIVINTYWRKFLDAAALNEDFHMFSAEKNGVVLVGRGIKQDSLMDKAEYDNLITELEFARNQVLDAEGKNLLKVVFCAASVEAMNHAVRFTPVSAKNHVIQDICAATVSLIKYGELCKKAERNYRAYFVHPVLVAVSEVCNYSMILESAEAPLASMTNYLNRHPDRKPVSDKEAYKADGIFVAQGVELGLCEISGPYQQNLPSKFQFDFIKGMYGCLSIFNDICSRYEFAQEATMSKLKIMFVHVKVDSLQVWSLQYVHGVFAMNRVLKTVVSSSIDLKSDTIMNLMQFVCLCRELLNESMDVIADMKNEHTAAKNEHYLNGAATSSLLDTIKPTIYKLTEKQHAAGLHKVRPSSFVLIPPQ